DGRPTLRRHARTGRQAASLGRSEKQRVPRGIPKNRAVGAVLDLNPCGPGATAQGVELALASEHDREMAKADVAVRGRRDAWPSPGVEADVVVVAARGDEHGAREMSHDVESDDVDVEAGGRLEVAHVEVDMAYRRLRVDGRLRLLVGNRLEQGVQIEWSRAAAHDGEIGPLPLRPVGGELDAVPIRIRNVDGLRDPVVGSALDRSSRD